MSDVDATNANFIKDVAALKEIGEVSALIAEANTAGSNAAYLVDGESGDTAFPYLSAIKPLATVGEYDRATGLPLTGYPDGHAAWLIDEDTIRVAYQSESYGTMSNETYPQEMLSGATFTGSQVHTIDYDRAQFADFLNNGDAASTMVKASGHLYSTIYNVFGDVVAPGGIWGNQALPDGTKLPYAPAMQLSDAEFFVNSFCGAHYEKANRYGSGIGFADDVYLCAEEWDVANMFPNKKADTLTTMGLASLVVDIANETAYTVPALGQSGYEKLLPINPGHPDYVVVVCAGYNFDLSPEAAPLKLYVGVKGLDADGNLVDPNGAASDRDKFLARNGLLYGKLYGMAVATADYAALNITPDADNKMMDDYLKDATAAENFSVKYMPTSYQWAGWDAGVAVADTEVYNWRRDGDDGEANEQPAGYIFFNGDQKTEHPAVDPDITKFRYVQNMTDEGALLGIEFTDLVAELTAANGDLPTALSANVKRIVSAVAGSMTLDVGNKGLKHDGVNTHATDRNNVAKMTAPDGLQWIRTADADVLIVDEDSGNSQGERKYALVLNPETLDLAVPGTGYFLAMAGGSQNPRGANEVSAYGGTWSRTTSAEFSGTWNVTALVAKKEDGSFYSAAELAGTAEQQVNEQFNLNEQTLIGVVQMKGESGGPVANFRCDQGGQLFMFGMELPVPGLKKVHVSDVDPSNTSFASDVAALKEIGEVNALIAEASTAGSNAAYLVDGESGDTAFPYLSAIKPLATVGEYDRATGLTLTGYPDGHAAWLIDGDTIRVAYQSESYATMSNETYPQEMLSGATFTGSQVHTIDYDRAQFADFLNNGDAASTMVKASGHLYSTIYNVFGDVVAPGGVWGNQALPDGTKLPYAPAMQLSDAEFFVNSFCGAHYEKANRYGSGIGFADDVYLCAEEWDVASMFPNGKTDSLTTMGLASLVVDIANETAYTVPALGQSGYEKLLPINPGHPDYVVVVCAGYNFDLRPEAAPLKLYVGVKGLDADGNPVDPNGAASDRDKFLARNGLLYGKLYGMAVATADYAALNITPDADDKMMDDYLKDATAAENFSVKYMPTSYQWAGWNAGVAVDDTEIYNWRRDGDDGEANEQPAGYIFFNGDQKTEHPAVDPDITKFRYVQNMTDEGALLGIEFTDLVAELTAANGDLPAALSANVKRIVSAVAGSMTLEVGNKGLKHDGVNTHATDRGNVAKMTAPDGLQWIRTADADVLIVDEDSGNPHGERKYALVLNPETLDLAVPGTGYFLAMAGGSQNPRGANQVSAYGGTWSNTTSAEFSGTWNVTALVAKKEDGSFYSPAELAGTAEQQVNEQFNLNEQTLIGVVQMKGESGGPVANFRCDQGGQLFAFRPDFPTLGGRIVFDAGTRGSLIGDAEQSVRAGDTVAMPTVTPEPGWKFVGWDQSVDSVSGELTVTAQYIEESSMNAYDVYSASQLQSLAVGPTLEADGNGNFVLKMNVRKSTDLTAGFEDMDNSGDNVSINPEGDIELEFSSPDDAAFYQISLP